MDLSDEMLPKKKRENFSLLSVEVGLPRALEGSAGKVLLLSDEGGFAAVAPFATHPRAVNLIVEGDALPLFAMPDGVSRVVAVGGEEVLLAARFFAQVRGIACELYPTDARLEGAFLPVGQMKVGGERLTYPLGTAAVHGDCDLVRPTLQGAYLRLLLSRLALFEERALHLLCGRQTSAVSERAAAVFSGAQSLTATQIFIKNALLRGYEAEGAPVGEGVTLAKGLFRAGVDNAEWVAFVQLSALYAAFFQAGKPRRYAVPDYETRARVAGDGQAEVATTEQYCARALALERFRTTLYDELNVLVSQGERCRAALSLPRDCAIHLEELKKLPERSNGLSALLRDFGLMEWEL